MNAHPKELLTEHLRINAVKSDMGLVFINDSTQDNFFSYKDLYQQSLSHLTKLQNYGITPGSEIIIQCDNNKSLLISFWACLMGKFIAVPLAANTQPDHSVKLLTVWNSLSKPYLIVDDRNITKLNDYCKSSLKQNEFKFIEEKRINLTDDACDSLTTNLPELFPDDIAYLQFSSGSTGDPKGVMLTHRNLVTNALDIAERSQITDLDSMLSWMPLSHDMGLICFHLTATLAGSMQYLMPTSLFIKRPILWMEKANQYRISILYSPNFGYQYFLFALRDGKDYDWDLSCIRVIYNGAELISEEICSSFLSSLAIYGLAHSSMSPGYGLAEASVAVSLPDPGCGVSAYLLDKKFLNVGSMVVETTSESGAAKYVSVGRPVRNCEVRVLGNRREILADGTIGHIWIRGKNVTRGYYNNEIETQKVISADGWLYTGDLGFQKNYNLVITGRFKNLIIVNGQNFHPNDIESLIIKKLGFEFGKVVACGVVDETSSKDSIVIFILTKKTPGEFANNSIRIKELISLELGLPVSAVISIPKIPKTTSGKIQHFKLVRDFNLGKFTEILSNISKFETMIKSAGLGYDDSPNEFLNSTLKQIVGQSSIAAGDDFFSIGISSLQATSIINTINHKYDVQLTIRDFFLNPYVDDLRKLILLKISEKRPVSLLPNLTDQYILSDTKKRFWSLHQIYNQTSALNICSAYELKGSVNTAFLKQAIIKLINDHKSLRSVFVNGTDATLYQIFLKQIEVDVTGVFEMCNSDLSSETIDQIVSETINFPFNLETGPLFRFKLFKRNDGHFVFLIVLHHLIADGWSFTVIAKDLATNYNALFVDGQIPKFPDIDRIDKELPTQQNLSSESNIQGSKAYWTAQLNDLVPAITLWNRKPAGLFSKKNCSKHVHIFSGETYQLLVEYSTLNHNTIFMSLLALIFVLLNRLSGTSDIALLTTSSGRARKDIEDQIGCFIETIILRTTTVENDNFQNLVDKVKKVLLDALHYNAYSFENIIKDLSAGRQPDENELFNVLVLFQNFSLDLDLTGISARPLEVRSNECLIDLQLEFIQNDSGLMLVIAYNSDVFIESDIVRLPEYMENLIHDFATNPGRNLHLVEMTSSTERSLLLKTFNDNDQSYPTGVTFVDLFRATVITYPNANALYFNGETITYEELDARSGNLGNYLVKRCDVCKGQRIALSLGRSFDSIVALIAVLKIGGTYVHVDESLPDDRRRIILELSDAKVFLGDLILPSDLLQQIKVISTNQIREIQFLDDKYVEFRRVLPTDNAYIIFTSGTLGKPKGIVVGHNSLFDYIMTFINYFGINEKDTVMHQASLSFDTSVEEIFPALAKGGTVIIHEGGGRDIAGIHNLIQNANVTILSTTPMVLGELNRKDFRPKKLRLLISGGEILRPTQIHSLIGKVDIYNTYGPTESTVCCTYYKIQKGENKILIGRPIANKKIYILDDKGLVQPLGVIGEIYIGGAGNARAYVDGEPLGTKLDSVDGSPVCFRSGDLGRWLPDGNIEFIGRKDTQLKVRGYRIELAEVEQVIAKFDLIEEFFVTTYYDDAGKTELICFYKSSFDLLSREIRQFCSSHLPEYMIPRFFKKVQVFPLTISGKIDIGLLPKPSPVSNFDPDEAGIISGVTEIRILNIWKYIFQNDFLMVHDDFFEIGGDSIKAFQIASKISNDLGLSIQVGDIFNGGVTVRELTARVLKNKEPQFSAITKLPPDTAYITSHSQKRFWILDQIDHLSSAGILNWSYEIEGDLDINAFRRTFVAIAERHETFRTSFFTAGKTLMQRILPAPEEVLIYHDFRGNKDALKLIGEIVNAEASCIFESHILLRTRLMHYENQKFVWVVSIHHLAADGWSIAILMQEITQLYSAYCSGGVSPLKEPAFQYKDYASWETDELRRLNNDTRTIECINRIRPAKGTNTLMPDFERPKNRRYQSSLVSARLPGEASEQLRSFYRNKKCTPTILLITALNCILYKYYNTQATSIGLMLNGRSHPSLDDKIGFFINTLPLSVDLNNQLNFSTLLDLIQVAVIDLMHFQYYPYDVLTQKIGGGKSLFSICVSSDIGDEDVFDIPGIKMKTFKQKSKWRNDFDLSMSFFELNDQLGLKILFDSDLYKRQTVEKFCDDIFTVLLISTQTPTVKISDISLKGVNQYEIKYWREYLFGYRDNLIFPVKPKKSSIDEFTANSIQLINNRDVAKQLTHFIDFNKISLESICAGLTAILFSRYNFKEEIVISLCKAHTLESESQVEFESGASIDNFLPLRLRVTESLLNLSFFKNIDLDIITQSNHFCPESLLSATNELKSRHVFDFLVIVDDVDQESSSDEIQRAGIRQIFVEFCPRVVMHFIRNGFLLTLVMYCGEDSITVHLKESIQKNLSGLFTSLFLSENDKLAALAFAESDMTSFINLILNSKEVDTL